MKMKKIERVLFDGTFYNGKNPFHGGGEYGKAVLQKALERKGIQECGIFFIKSQPVQGNILTMCIEKGIRIHPICDIRNIPNIIKKYHYTTVYSAIPYRNWECVKSMEDIRFICSFHGLRTLELADMEASETGFYNQSEIINRDDFLYGCSHSENYKMNRELYKNTLLAFKNSKIITGSQHTKYSIYQHFPELQSLEIEVLDDPMKLQEIDIDIDEEKKILDIFKLRETNYGMIISASIWYKNGLRGILAYDAVFEKNYSFVPDDYKVVVLGVKNVNNFANRLKHPDRFVFQGYVENTVLEVLYKYAHLFLFLSINEGYGYPALEAMKYGTLCACSVNTSISEVCQDMVLYFNPLLIDEIENRILQSFSTEIRSEKEKIIAEKLPTVKKQQLKALEKIVNIIFNEA